MFNKIISCCMLSFLLLSGVATAAAYEPVVTAKSAIVMEAMTGRVLYEKNANEQRYPASTTKIATLITALEYGNVNDLIIASEEASMTEGSSLCLNAGERLPMLDMLYGVMLISGNDATVAIAEHIAGSVPEFARLMTQKAHSIGAVHTNFMNSSGLPDPNHYTTAYDLALITAYGYHNELFRQIVGTKNRYIVSSLANVAPRDIYNENRMLWLYDGGNGVKTGYTQAAGKCLVSGANRNGVQLITVILDSEQMWNDSIALLDYGFSMVMPHKVIDAGTVVKNVRVRNGFADNVQVSAAQDIIMPYFTDENDDSYKLETIIDSNIQAPLRKGQRLGAVNVVYNGKIVATDDLLSETDVQRKSLFTLLWTSIRPALRFL